MRCPPPSPLLLALLLLANCNQSEPPRGARCGTFAACGGDVVGTWGIEESCASASAAEDCPQSLLRYSSYNRTGTYTFGESGELVMTQRTRYTLNAGVPLSCLGGASCATYESLLESELGGSGQTIDADASCRDGGSSCSCTVETSIQEMLSGSYETDGSTLTLSNGIEYEYCVDDSELSLKSGPFEVFFVKFQ